MFEVDNFLRRWGRLRQNTGVVGVIRTVLILVVVLGLAIGAPGTNSRFWPVPIGVAAGLALPRLTLDALMARFETAVRVHRVSGFAIVIAVFVARQPIKNAGPWGLAACGGLLAAYISAYFWIMSDDDVTVHR